jgi:oligopeptide/dipeptide ABC transporter ATP-binding protein
MNGGDKAGATLLAVDRLEVRFKTGRGKPAVRAVDGVTLTVATDETVGVVGESGSGKTTLGRAILGLVQIAGGGVSFDGEDITEADQERRRALSGQMQVVFQDPYSSLNPTRTVGQTLAETLRVQRDLPAAELDRAVAEMLQRVGLPADAGRRYPGSFSGGQRQRIAIARALIVRPRLVICDEPVSALDLSVQAQVLNLLRELQREMRVSYLFIAHDLDVVRHLSDRIIVLYRGQVMEEGEAETVCGRPAHPYTRALLDAAPVPDPDLQRQRRRARLARTSAAGEQSSVGCPFAGRCPHTVEVCRERRPALETTPGGVKVACHRWRELRSGEALAGSPATGSPDARDSGEVRP